MGGFKKVDSTDMVELQSDSVFSEAMKLAREGYSAESNGELGKLLAVYRQIVSGVNYKMIFETKNGDYEIVVFTQPWTNTYAILSMKPAPNNY
jgi:hypothetical protein